MSKFNDDRSLYPNPLTETPIEYMGRLKSADQTALEGFHAQIMDGSPQLASYLLDTFGEDGAVEAGRIIHQCVDTELNFRERTTADDFDSIIESLGLTVRPKSVN